MVGKGILLAFALAIDLHVAAGRDPTSPQAGESLDLSGWNGSHTIMIRGWQYMGDGIYQTPNGRRTIARFDRGRNKVFAIIEPVKENASGRVLAIRLVETLAIHPGAREKEATLCFRGDRLVPFGYVIGSRVSRVVESDGLRLRELKFPNAREYRCELHHH